MPSAEIITIGTEILLGEIQDTNTSFLARQLMSSGIDLFRTHTIGDNPERIAQTVRDSLKRADIVITTGGLGPTVDDPTREAVALAVNRPLIFHPGLWEEIRRYYDRIGRIPPENNKRQAYMPDCAQPIHNPIGTAPGFVVQVENSVVISVPGVPKEMEYLTLNFILPYLKMHFTSRMIIKSRTVHVSGMGESQLDMIIGELEKLSNPTVGLLAKPGQIDIRVAAKADSDQNADDMILRVIDQLHDLLGVNIYGFDQDNLIDVIANLLRSYKPIVIIDSGLNGELKAFFHAYPEICQGSESLEIENGSQALEDCLLEKSVEWNNTFLFGSSFNQKDGISSLDCGIWKDGIYTPFSRKFAGPPEIGHQWAVNTSLDILRRYLTNH
jgi:nicotinamide-nucleotide amidase